MDLVERSWPQRVVREDADGLVRVDADGAEVLTLPGGIWGHVFDDRLARNILLHAKPALSPTEVSNWKCDVSVCGSQRFNHWGEQAGIFFYKDDYHYVKLVCECKKDGTVQVVFALEEEGNPRVVEKATIEKDEDECTLSLRIEWDLEGPSSSSLSCQAFACVNGKPIGHISLSSSWAIHATFALSSHGGPMDGKEFKRVVFNRFTVAMM